MTTEDNSSSGKGPKRKLSRFLCREMLYDYVSSVLDSSRKEAVDEFLKQDPETQRDLANIEEGLSYCTQLGETRISVPLMQEIRDHKGFWGSLREGRLWSAWPDSLKWGIEAVAISAIAAIVAMVIPWKKVSEFLPTGNNDVVLVEVQKDDKLKRQKAAGLVNQGEGRVSPSVPPEVPKDSVAVTPPKTAGAKTTSQPKDSKAEPPLTPPPGVESSDKDKKAEADKKTDTVEVAKDNKGETSSPERKPLKGFVYRAFMNLEGLDQKTPEIVQGVKGLGGTKAGQVELGWRKPKGSYFHFSLPESNYEELVKILRNFGPVRIYKDPHWRVMPEGKIRFILWVEDSRKVKK